MMMEGGHGLRHYAQCGTAHACPFTITEQKEVVKCTKKKGSKLKKKLSSAVKLLKSCCGWNQSLDESEVAQKGSSSPVLVQDHGSDELLTNVGSTGISKQYSKHYIERLAKETGVTFRNDDSGYEHMPCLPQIECHNGRKEYTESSSLSPHSPHTEASTSNSEDTEASTSNSEDEMTLKKVISPNTSCIIDSKKKAEDFYMIARTEDTHCTSTQTGTITSSSCNFKSGFKTEDISGSSDGIKGDESDSEKGLTLDECRSTKLHTARTLVNNCCSFRYFCRSPFLVNMFPGNSLHCHPRYEDIEKRKDSLKNCNNQQLRGFSLEELARTGWFFNQRALTTFCCGMEMPTMPNGGPLNVHCSLSPQCAFARSIPMLATHSEMAIAQTEESSSQASGGVAELTFKSPIQATDDGSGQTVSFASEWNEDFREFTSQNVAGRDLYAFPSMTSSYMRNTVTNTTQLPSEDLSRDSETAQQRPAGRNLDNNGQLHMRGGYQNPLGNARLMRELEAGAVGRQNHMHNFLPIDQINVDGEEVDGYRARYPQFGFPEIRSWTFDGWPMSETHPPEIMAEAGFFYAGYGDNLLCYSCGISIRHWLREDDPWVEHARWRPSCVFLKAIQGQEFIDAVRNLCRRSYRRRPTIQEVRREVTDRTRRAAQRGNTGNE